MCCGSCKGDSSSPKIDGLHQDWVWVEMVLRFLLHLVSKAASFTPSHSKGSGSGSSEGAADPNPGARAGCSSAAGGWLSLGVLPGCQGSFFVTGRAAKPPSLFPPPRTPLHYAAANGSYQCTVTLVTAGASINEADCKGCTPLHYAAASDTYRR